MGAPDDFSAYMEAAARHLLGEPNPHLSSLTELRFGKQGSMAVDLAKGTFFDHESKEGGGVIDLVARVAGVRNGAAVDYLRNEVGVDIPDNRQQPAVKTQRKIVATYDYQDAAGNLLFQVVRMEPKDFRQRRPDPSSPDGWNWSVKGVQQVPYRLPEVAEALAMERTVYVAEGEKDVDALWKIGVPATCNAGGAGKWPSDLTGHFIGADVVLLPDNDEAGRNHVAIVGAALKGAADRVRVVHLPGLPLKGDPFDWIHAGGDAERLHELTESTSRPWTPGAPESRFGAILWADMDRNDLKQEWLVEDLIIAGTGVLMFGASGSGKSFLAVDMAHSIARGVPFLGKACKAGPVLYQAGEGGKGLLKRLKAYRQVNMLQGANLPFVLLPARVNLFAKDGETDVNALEAECLAWAAYFGEPLAAIFIDTLSTASAGANENASEDMGRMLAAGDRLGRATGATVAWVHHKNAAGDRERGHSSLRANLDTALEVIRDEVDKTKRTIRVSKVKDGEDGEEIGFKLQSIEIGSNDDGKPITSCVVVPAQEGSQQTGKRTYLPTGQYKFLKILDDAIIQRGGAMPPIDRIPPHMPGVSWHDFRELYVAINSQSMDQNAIKQALKRDGDKLLNMGIINRHETYIWITERGMLWLR